MGDDGRNSKHKPDTPDFFRNGEGWGGDDGARRLVRHELQDHQAPRDDLAPAALVLALGDPVVPVRLGVVLLGVEDGAGDVLGDVVRHVVADDKGDRLTLADVDSGHHALAQHPWLHDLGEVDDGPAVVAALAAVDADVELELGSLALEGGRLALGAVVDGLFLEDGGDVRLGGVFKGGKDLDI